MKFFSLFFLAFALLISFQAYSSSSVYVDYPQSCFTEKKYPCTLKTSQAPLQMDISGNRTILDQDSSLQFSSEASMQLLKGRVYFNFAQDSEIRLSANLPVQFSGEIFLEKSSDGMMRMKNLNGQIQFQSKYVFENEALPTGFENWYGPLAENGQILRGVMRPIEKEAFMKSWMPMNSMSVAEIRRKMKEYLDLWSGAVEQSAQFYQEVAQRRLASQAEKRNQIAEKQKRKEDEKDQLRRLYREKNGL